MVVPDPFAHRQAGDEVPGLSLGTNADPDAHINSLQLSVTKKSRGT